MVLGECIDLKFATDGEFITVLSNLGGWLIILGHFSFLDARALRPSVSSALLSL